MRLTSGYGGSVYIFMRDMSKYSTQLYKMLLPLQYTEAISDSDIDEINNDKIWLNIV
jgi:hypothetical protein